MTSKRRREIKIILLIASLILTLFFLKSNHAVYANNAYLYFDGIPKTLSEDDIGTEITAKIMLGNANSVFSVNMTVFYDSSMIELLDNDASMNGINLKANPLFGMIKWNEARILENGLSTIKFTGLSLDSPLQGNSIEIAEMKFKVKKSGVAHFVFKESNIETT